MVRNSVAGKVHGSTIELRWQQIVLNLAALLCICVLSSCQQAALTVNEEGWRRTLLTRIPLACKQSNESTKLEARAENLVAEHRYDEAWSCYTKALALDEARLGKDNPALIENLYTMTQYPFVERKDHISLMKRLIHLREQLLGRDSADLLDDVCQLCSNAPMIGPEAEHEAISYLSCCGAKSDSQVRQFVVLACLTELTAHVSHRREGLAMLERCHDMATKINEQQLPDDLKFVCGEALIHLGRAARSVDQVEDSCIYLSRAVYLLENWFGSPKRRGQYMRAVFELAESQLSKEDFRGSEQTLERIRPELETSSSQWMMEFYLLKAEINGKLGRNEVMQTLLEKAERLTNVSDTDRVRILLYKADRAESVHDRRQCQEMFTSLQKILNDHPEIKTLFARLLAKHPTTAYDFSRTAHH